MSCCIISIMVSYDLVRRIPDFNLAAFKGGAILILFSLCCYIEGHLLIIEEEEALFATIPFWIKLFFVGFISFMYLMLLDIYYPTPNLRDTFEEMIHNNNNKNSNNTTSNNNNRSCWQPNNSQKMSLGFKKPKMSFFRYQTNGLRWW